MRTFNTRNDLISALPKNLIMAELGVFKGEFSHELLTRMQPKELYLVDIWQGSYVSGDKDGNNHVNVDDMELVYNDIKKRYECISEVKVVRCPSGEYLESCANNTFDMIYVDADHSYEAVTNDLQLSFLKIHNSGLLMGHDYIRGTQIAKAVDDFCVRYQQTIEVLTHDGCPTFLIQVKK